jgi:PAS domain S-box-containing protein
MFDAPLPHLNDIPIEAGQAEFAIQLNQRLQELLTTPSPTTLEDEIGQALQVAGWMSGTPLAAFYQIEAEQPFLRQAYTSGAAELLPERISLRDLTNLRAPLLWTPQQRPLTGLHRAARTARLSYVASAVVGENFAPIGLVVVAGGPPEGHLTQPPETALSIVQILARHLSGLIIRHQQAQRAAQRLSTQESELARLELIQNALQDGVIRLSPERNIENMNEYAEQMLGYASREVRGQPVENVLIGHENLTHALDIAKNLDYPQNMGAVTLYRRDGKAFLAGMRIQPLSTPGQSTTWAVLLQDLSQEEQNRLRIQQLEQRALLGEVTAIFAHEVRNPINNISTGLQLMSLSLPAEAAEQAAIGRMLQDCDRLSELMKAVLAFARPQEFKLEALEVEPFLRRLLERWHPRLARANVSYELHCEAKLPGFQADPRALEQVFSNLIHNAMQAMDTNGGKLVLRVRQNFPETGGHYVEISIADSGPGIPEDLRERVFEPFFTTKTSGTGLGLAITRQIVTAHRGLIRITSIPGGTAFQVLLPAS